MKKNTIWLILTLVMLAIFGIMGYYGYQTFFQSTDSSTSVSTTSAEDGYIQSSVAPAITGAQEVSDVGEAQWVKVPSDKKLEKFTDLSKNGITIYRINNPEVLKTVTSVTTPAVLIAETIAKYPSTLIINASAFNMETGYSTGLQINNGLILRDWSTGGGSNQYAFTISDEGTCKIYDATTPASQMIAEGVQQAYTFSTAVSAIIRDGQLLNNGGQVDWKIHTFLANDKDNNLYAIISDTNAGYQNIIDTVADLNLENMLLLDGGGSSQMSVNGQIVYPSQDNRAVPDYIVMR